MTLQECTRQMSKLAEAHGKVFSKPQYEAAYVLLQHIDGRDLEQALPWLMFRPTFPYMDSILEACERCRRQRAKDELQRERATATHVYDQLTRQVISSDEVHHAIKSFFQRQRGPREHEARDIHTPTAP